MHVHMERSGGEHDREPDHRERADIHQLFEEVLDDFDPDIIDCRTELLLEVLDACEMVEDLCRQIAAHLQPPGGCCPVEADGPPLLILMTASVVMKVAEAMRGDVVHVVLRSACDD